MKQRSSLRETFNIDSLAIGIGAVLAGDAAANIHGNAEFFPATICIIFVIFAQLAANSYHRYHDNYKNLGESIDRQILSGSRSVSEIDSKLLYKGASKAFMLLAIIAGCSLIIMGGWWTFPVGLFILAMGWMMVGGAVPVMLTPWSPALTFLLFGPVAVISVCLIQSLQEADPQNIISWFDISPAIFMGCCIGLMAANCDLANNYSNLPLDIRNSRETFTVVFGRRATRILFLINGIIAPGFIVASCFLMAVTNIWLPIIHAVIFMIFSIYIYRLLVTLPRHKLDIVVKLSYLNVFLMGLTASIVSLFVGFPDDSYKVLF